MENECYPLWIGTVSSVPEDVAISGAAVSVVHADVSFDPAVWNAQWAFSNSPSILANISNIENHSGVNEVDLSTIRLNGTVGIVDGSASIADGVLTIGFDRSEAVRSLGTAFEGEIYATVEGRVGDDVFSGSARVEIQPVLIIYANKHTVGWPRHPP